MLGCLGERCSRGACSRRPEHADGDDANQEVERKHRAEGYQDGTREIAFRPLYLLPGGGDHVEATKGKEGQSSDAKSTPDGPFGKNGVKCWALTAGSPQRTKMSSPAMAIEIAATWAAPVVRTPNKLRPRQAMIRQSAPTRAGIPVTAWR